MTKSKKTSNTDSIVRAGAHRPEAGEATGENKIAHNNAAPMLQGTPGGVSMPDGKDGQPSRNDHGHPMRESDTRAEGKAAPRARRTAILVLGMHRSGTSAVTQVINHLGVDLPQGLLEAREDNPAGFAESWRVQQLNDELLAMAGSGWDDWRQFNQDWYQAAARPAFQARAVETLRQEFSASPLFVLKDPRICRLLPFWVDALRDFEAEAYCVLPLRSPLEVAASLKRRDNFSPAKSFMLWLRHVIDAEACSRNLGRAFVRYDALLDDWRGVIGDLARTLDLAWPRRSATAEVEIDRFLQHRHRHHVLTDQDVFDHPDLPLWVKETYSALASLVDNPSSDEAQRTLDAVRIEFDRASAALGAVVRSEELAAEAASERISELERAAADGKARVTDLEQAVGEREARIGELERSAAQGRAHVTQLEHAVGELERTAADGHAHVTELEQAVGEREARIGELERAGAGSHAYVQQLSTLRTEHERRIDELQTALIDEQAERATVAKQRSVLVQRLDAVQTSDTWRVCSPLRNAESRWPRLLRSAVAVPRMLWWTLTFRLRPRLHLRRTADTLLRSGLFDRGWYIEHNPDVVLSGAHPVYHWLLTGWKEGRDPNRLFDTSWYLEQNADVALHGINPLLHYQGTGAAEGRNPSPLFDTDWYVAQYSDVNDSGLNPLAHYLKFGEAEGRSIRPNAETLSGTTTPPCPSADEFISLYQRMLADAGRVPSNPEYVQKSEVPLDTSSLAVRVIAFYLPQFHPIPENDEWWGKGFTEWTNVTKAVPQFVGHYQPHLAGELGFYDLRVADVQRQQVALAKHYGIYGFCFHYYWFAGRKLLERPLEQFLSDTELDFPFCICWANENWTRRWDGQENEVLLKQDHSSQTDLAFIDDVIPLFRDPRYITVRGKPLLIVYRVDLLPDPERTVAQWRSRCLELGIEEPLLVAAQTFGITDPRPFGFQAAVQFPPHNSPAHDVTQAGTLLNTEFAGRIYSYRSLVDAQVTRVAEEEPYLTFECAVPGWDNEPRKPAQGHVYAGSSPRLYAEWLTKLCEDSFEKHADEERLVFINAWNEWAEGAHLEPDRRYGHAYLRATATSLKRCRSKTPIHDQGPIAWLDEAPGHRYARIAVIAHLYYPELREELIQYLGNVAEPVDLLVTLVREQDADELREHLPANVKRCSIGLVANRGRDIRPFLHCLPIVQSLGYELALKIHSKGTGTRDDGDKWRQDMLSKVVGSVDATTGITTLMRSDPSVGLVAPTGHLLPADYFWGIQEEAALNLMHFDRLAPEASLPRQTRGFVFPAGSTYWFRPRALATMATLPADESLFPAEHGQRDGTAAHAIERLVGLAVSTDGWRAEVTSRANEDELTTEWLAGPQPGIYPFACATIDGAAFGGPVPGIR